MLVVRKLDRELPFVFGLRRLVRGVGFAKAEARSFARRGAQMTNRADDGSGSAHRLA